MRIRIDARTEKGAVPLFLSEKGLKKGYGPIFIQP